MLRVFFLGAVLVGAGCSTPSGFWPDQLTLGPWRTILDESPVCALAANMSDRDHALVALEDAIALICLRDGAIERKRAIALPYEPMAIVPLLWSGDRMVIGVGSKMIILKNWELEEERPLPHSYEAGLVEDRRTGDYVLTTPEGVFSWDRDSRSWKCVVNGYQLLLSQPTPGAKGSILLSGGIFRGDGQYTAFGSELGHIAGAWRSSDDPQFVLAAAYPSPAVSRDGGRSWVRSQTEFWNERHCAGFDAGQGRLLFVESHSLKIGVGALHGPSELWVSRDDGRTFEREKMPDRACSGMVIVGHTLVMSLQWGGVVAADIVPRTSR
jgi:hypothetical protein